MPSTMQTTNVRTTHARRDLFLGPLLGGLCLFVTACQGRTASRVTSEVSSVSPVWMGLAPAARPGRPLVIAHRGASGHRPEHTLAAYALAVEQGADFIEPDLVSTRDRVLVARHENEIGGTTDVATRFPSRKTRKVIDGDTVEGWFTEDFTLAELKTLRARERLPFRSQAYNGQFDIPTLDEVLALADSLGRRRGRAVGVYPETKHPSYHRQIGLPLEERLLDALRRHGLDRRDAPVFIQSFEDGNLRQLRGMTRVPLVYLIAAGRLDAARLRDIASFADAVGLNQRMLVGADSSARPGTVVQDAKAAGLRVHVWTLRPEPAFLAKRYGGDPAAEVRELVGLGVDGFFTDFPDVTVGALRGLGLN